MKNETLLGLIVFLIGFISLFLETVSFSVTYFYVTESSHVAALVLSAFLCGIALASILADRLTHKSPEKMVRALTLITGAATVYIFLFFLQPHILGSIVETIHKASLSPLFNFIAIWFFLFIPGFLVGAIFPLILQGRQAFTSANRMSVSKLYAIDVFGGTIGALFAGFVCIPHLGIQTSLLILLFFSLLTLWLVFSLSKINSWQNLAMGILVASSATLIAISLTTTEVLPEEMSNIEPNEYIPYHDRFGKIVFQETSPFGVITIGDAHYEDPDLRRLHINYRGMCNNKYHASEQFIASTASDNIDSGSRVLSIGLGCGFTLEALLASQNIEHVDLYEINPVIAENSTKYFFSEAENPLNDPRVNLINQDGLVPLRESDANTYNAVIIDVEEPGVIQSSPLYTQEYLQEVKRILVDDGMLSLWAIRGGDIYNKILFKTLESVFKNVYITEHEAGVQLFASDRWIYVKDGKKFTNQELQDIPLNLLYENSLQKNYSIKEAFKLPDYFEDPFIEQEH